MRKKYLFGSPIILIILGSLFWWQKYTFYDWWRLRGYHPSAEIVQLADRAVFNQSSRRLFYVYHPTLDDKADFNNHCNNHEQTIVLGCYISAEGIFIYNIKDSRLDGIKEVTAAHETLHAAYQRLSVKEKRKIDQLTNEAFASVTDQRIIKTIENYRSRDLSVVPNELHSILGTEIRTLPLELENYYKRYFTDRSKIVDLLDKYQANFTDREKQVEDFDNQLNVLKNQITDTESKLSDISLALQTRRQQLNDLLTNQNYQSYNNLVPSFNSDIRGYNNQVVALQALVDKYNDIVAKRNAIAIEAKELAAAIDSRPQEQNLQ